MLKTYSRKHPYNNQLQRVHELCRLCLKKCNDYAPIFTETSTGSELTPLAYKISNCIGVELLVHDHLPNKICQKCFQDVEGYYSFRKKCAESCQRLHLHLKSIDNTYQGNHVAQENTFKDFNIPIDVDCNDITVTKVNLDNIKLYVSNEPKGTSQNCIDNKIIDNVTADPKTNWTVLTKDLELNKVVHTDLISNENIECSNEVDVKAVIKEKEDRKRGALNQELPLQSTTQEETNQEIICITSTNQREPEGEEINTIPNLFVSEVNYPKAESEENIESQDSATITELPKFLSNLLQDLGLMVMSDDESELKQSPITVQLITKDEDIVLDIVEESDEMELPVNIVSSENSDTNTSLVCKLCKKLFKTKSSLTRHHRIHLDERPFQCSQCPKTFTQYSIMKRHQSLHSETRPFKCSYCERSFSQRSNLQFHEKSHAKTKEYEIHVCPKCSKTFLHSSGLSRHMKAAHQGRLYPCVTCLRPFNDMSALHRHAARHHKNKDTGKTSSSILTIKKESVNTDSIIKNEKSDNTDIILFESS